MLCVDLTTLFWMTASKDIGQGCATELVRFSTLYKIKYIFFLTKKPAEFDSTQCKQMIGISWDKASITSSRRLICLDGLTNLSNFLSALRLDSGSVFIEGHQLCWQTRASDQFSSIRYELAMHHICIWFLANEKLLFSWDSWVFSSNCWRSSQEDY